MSNKLIAVILLTFFGMTLSGFAQSQAKPSSGLNLIDGTNGATIAGSCFVILANAQNRGFSRDNNIFVTELRTKFYRSGLAINGLNYHQAQNQASNKINDSVSDSQLMSAYQSCLNIAQKSGF